jgi:IS5 family transposase
MRPKKHETTGSSDLFRARLDRIINMKNELVRLAGKIDWDWLDSEMAPLYSDRGDPSLESLISIKNADRGPDCRFNSEFKHSV